jgi:hypothetical protein
MEEPQDQLPMPRPTPPQPGVTPTHTHEFMQPDQTRDLQLHEESKLRFPHIRLSPNEYVIEAVRRHPIGLISIWAVAGFIILIFLMAVPAYALNKPFLAQLFMAKLSSMPSAATLMTPALILAAFAALGGAIATIVYMGNRFYLTNESIIQQVQYSLFSTKIQTVNLINVEDASATQTGILQQVLNYGTLRISTQGEETIYNFRFVFNPGKVANDVTDAMEIAVKKMEGHYPVTEF